jgi:hypothetical protein
MKRIWLILAAYSALQAQDLTADWQGALKIGATELRSEGGAFVSNEADVLREMNAFCADAWNGGQRPIHGMPTTRPSG